MLIDVSNPIKADHPINRSLIGCWGQIPYSYTNARIRDQLGRNDMTLDSGASLAMVGPTGRGVRFSSGTLTVPSSVFRRVNGNGLISIGLWIYPTSIASYRTVLDSTNRQTSFFLNTTSDGFIGFGGSAAGITFSPSFTTNEWQYVLLTYDGATAKVYRNGVLVGSHILGNTTFTDNMVFGTNPSSGGTNYQGLQAGWRVWARTFNARQAEELYQHARQGFEDTYNTLGPETGTTAPNDFTLIADYGAYTLSGQDVTLTQNTGVYTLTADYGLYQLTGQNVNLVTDMPTAYTMAADYGAYVLSGQPVNMTVGIQGFEDPVTSANLGRFRRGTRLPLLITPYNSPDACPQIDFWKNGTLVRSVSLPGRDHDRTIFSIDLLAGSEFTDGHYVAVITYSTSAVPSVHYRYFQIKGGDSQGNVVSVIELRRRLGRAVVSHREDGNVAMGYNPRLE